MVDYVSLLWIHLPLWAAAGFFVLNPPQTQMFNQLIEKLELLLDKYDQDKSERTLFEIKEVEKKLRLLEVIYLGLGLVFWILFLLGIIFCVLNYILSVHSPSIIPLFLYLGFSSLFGLQTRTASVAIPGMLGFWTFLIIIVYQLFFR